MNQFAYIRVSTRDQNIDRQLAAIKPYGIPDRQIYIDWQSGKDFQRPAYQRLMRRLRPGDLLIVMSIDRLGRNYEEILDQWRHITKTLRADILVIDMPLLDTREKNGDLTGAFIADLVLQILAYVAQTERDFILRRQAEGIAAARERGVRFGRRPEEVPEAFEAVCEQCRRRDLTIRAASDALGMSRASFYRKYRAWMEQLEGSVCNSDLTEL